MITKRTDKLQPGDRVYTPNGDQVIHSVKQTEVDPAWGDLLVKYIPRQGLPGPWGAYANASDTWQVFEPSKLDEAVQRAQELADTYRSGRPYKISEALVDFHKLLDMFRAAR